MCDRRPFLFEAAARTASTRNRRLWLVLFLVALGLQIANCVQSVDDVLHESDRVLNYYGTIHENEVGRVKLMPRIHYKSNVVCKISILPDHGSESSDFSLEKTTTTALVNDDGDGGDGDDNTVEYDEWFVKNARAFNYEAKSTYRFRIAIRLCAIDSQTRKPTSFVSTVHVTVIDVNEYAPEFLEKSYVADVDENRMYESIVRTIAVDQDMGSIYGHVYKYAILPDNINLSRGGGSGGSNSKLMFDISKDGVIRNLQPLRYDDAHNHILKVVAFDGGHNASKPVLVTVRVKRPSCRPRWAHLPQSIKYNAKSTVKYLIPVESRLDTCNYRCPNASMPVQYTIALELLVKHLGNVCNQESNWQSNVCGAKEADKSRTDFELLPLEKDHLVYGKWFGDQPAASFTDDRDRDRDMDNVDDSDEVFYFNGQTTALTVPEDYFDENKLSTTFSISSWIKHDQHSNQDKHVKEHILCSADDHKMNRHHYALFVRNCRLILLLRRDFANGNLNIFKPAEWRWKMAQICDNEWHHYTIVVSFPNVTLFVDGVAYDDHAKRNGANGAAAATSASVEVIDDWPLHPTKDIRTRLTVGACWQGGENRMKHHFNGRLAGLTISTNVSGDARQLAACQYRCRERLSLPKMAVDDRRTLASINTNANLVTFSGNDVVQLQTLVKQVSYANDDRTAAVKKRHLNLITYFECGGKIEEASNQAIMLFVTNRRRQTTSRSGGQRSISLNGTDHVVRKHTELENGVRIFPDLLLHATDSDPVVDFTLDLCRISVTPPLNLDHENLSVVDSNNFMLQVRNDANENFEISGKNSIFTYRQVLRQVQYSNSKPFYYLSRVFKLKCYATTGTRSTTSNEYTQVVSFLHPRVGQTATNTLRTHDDNGVVHHENHLPMQFFDFQASHQPLIGASPSMTSSMSVVVIVVVCACFMLFLVVMGAIHVHNYFNVRTHGFVHGTRVLKNGKLDYGHDKSVYVEYGEEDEDEEEGGDDDDDEYGDGDDDDDDDGGGEDSDDGGDFNPEMAWDDSGMSIIVNPMERLNKKKHIVDRIGVHSHNSDEYFADGYVVDEQSRTKPTRSTNDADVDSNEDVNVRQSLSANGRNPKSLKTRRSGRKQYQNVNQLEWDHSAF